MTDFNADLHDLSMDMAEPDRAHARAEENLSFTAYGAGDSGGGTSWIGYDQYPRPKGYDGQSTAVDWESSLLPEYQSTDRAYRASPTQPELNLPIAWPLMYPTQEPLRDFAEFDFEQSSSGLWATSRPAESVTAEDTPMSVSTGCIETSGTSAAESAEEKVKRIKDLMAELAVRDIRVTSKVTPRVAPIEVLESMVKDARTNVAVNSGNPDRYVIDSDAEWQARKHETIDMTRVTWSFRPASDVREWTRARSIGDYRTVTESSTAEQAERIQRQRNFRHEAKLTDLMVELASRDVRYISKVSPRRAPVKVLQRLVQVVNEKVKMGSGNPERYVIFSDAPTGIWKKKVDMKSVNWSLRPASDETEWDAAQTIRRVLKSKTKESHTPKDDDLYDILGSGVTVDDPLLQEGEFLPCTDTGSSVCADYGDYCSYPVPSLEYPILDLPDLDWSIWDLSSLPFQ